ncbi:unnamed protein product [Nippostrongylus brasiliensis]|uniref:BHLH domain-containing protein n=1 Tax=Nippostrongylus brasiliensis TaxID=27835 RepID=A0A0N4XR52_NIPBR|nr:unnamed protein product [Nippostrongylus brasiliensis]
MIKTVRQFTNKCTLLSIESMIEQSSADNQIRTDVYWKLFESASVEMVAGKVQPWFRLENIVEDVEEDGGASSGILPNNWRSASISKCRRRSALAKNQLKRLLVDQS